MQSKYADADSAVISIVSNLLNILYSLPFKKAINNKIALLNKPTNFAAPSQVAITFDF